MKYHAQSARGADRTCRRRRRRARTPKREKIERVKRTCGTAAESVAAESAPKPSASGLGTSPVTTTPFVAATRKNAIDSLFTYLTICATSPYGVGDGALGYAGFVFAKIAPSCAPGACNVGRCGPGGTTRSQDCPISQSAQNPACFSCPP